MTHSIDNQALERFRIIRPFLEDGIPLAQLAEEHAIALRTLQRWVRRYRSNGMAGLARKRRSDKGVSRRLAMPLVELVEAPALETPHRSMAAIHRLVWGTSSNGTESRVKHFNEIS